jgi:hypothetical protein
VFDCMLVFAVVCSVVAAAVLACLLHVRRG